MQFLTTKTSKKEESDCSFPFICLYRLTENGRILAKTERKYNEEENEAKGEENEWKIAIQKTIIWTVILDN